MSKEKEVVKKSEEELAASPPNDDDGTIGEQQAEGSTEQKTEKADTTPDKTEEAKAETKTEEVEKKAETKGEKVDVEKATLQSVTAAVKSAVGSLHRIASDLGKAAGVEYGYESSSQKRDGSVPEVSELSKLAYQLEQLTAQVTKLTKRDEEEKSSEDDNKLKSIVEEALKPVQKRLEEFESSYGGSKGVDKDETDTPVQKRDSDAVDWSGVL